MKDTKEIYIKRKNRYNALLQKQIRAANLISNLRLVMFILGLACAVLIFTTDYFYIFGAGTVIFLFLFIYLIVQHSKIIENKVYSSHLCDINDNSIKRINNEWTQFSDVGSEFEDESHNFSQDLDIFGNGSVFQWINTAKTYIGRRIFKRILTENPESIAMINKRQDAVKELAEKLWWRQRFHAEAMTISDEVGNPANLINWANEKRAFFHNKGVVIFLRLLTIATAALMIMSFAFNLVPYYIPIAALVLQYLLLKIKGREFKRIFEIAEKYSKEINIYSKMLKLFEEQKFTSERLNELKSSISSIKDRAAYIQVEKLAKIIDFMSNRYNAFYLILNIITLCDYHLLISLEKWKKESGQYLNKWLDVLGEAEALSSLAIINYDHPDWIRPVISEEMTGFRAENMGHPLLPESRVCNDLSITDKTKVLLITGSNMSGKSTFLRTSGINIVLAYAGASVCASSFCVPIVEVFTCMRVRDNLEKNISSFYAELLRIKTIITGAREGRRVFFLLDEIFKGTNSLDRHTGAKMLINELCKTNACGLVSTHDLELSSMEEENSKIKNYHFREYYKNNEIYFDYKLRAGASTTRNAMFLMKLAGIE